MWKKSYSQGNEDLVIAKILNYKSNGFFIDVGANDPIRLNNTYLFYKNGWQGISAEPIPSLAKKIRSVRSTDIVLEKAVSNYVGKAEFNVGINKYDVNSSLIDHNLGDQEKITVEVTTLEKVLDDLLIKNIDLLCIDTEGTEIDVLEGLNFDKYQPKIILAEYNTISVANSKLIPYLLNKGYQPIFINTWNIIFSQDFEKDAIKCYKQESYMVNLKNILKQFLKKS
jgi:FkbM family methyltransferase